MAKPKRGIYVEKTPWVFKTDPPDLRALFKREKPLLRWRCTQDFRIAEFQERKSPRHTAIVHPSIKHAGKWQLTFFDNDEPTGDIQGSSCDELLRELRPRSWRLRTAGPQLAGGELGRPFTRGETAAAIVETRRALALLRRGQYCRPVACRIPRRDGRLSRCPTTYPTKSLAVDAILDANPRLAAWIEAQGTPSYRAWVQRGRRGPKPFPGQRERGLDAFDIRWDLRGRNRVGTWMEALYRTLAPDGRWRTAAQRLAFFEAQVQDAGGPQLQPPPELSRLLLADAAMRQCHENLPKASNLRKRLARLRKRLPKAPWAPF